MQGGKEKGKKAKLEKQEQELKAKAVGKSQQTELKQFEYDNPTEPGEKKNISGAWPPAYNPSVIEKSWYEWWDKNAFFNPDKQQNINKELPGFTIVIPPPNVTGSLHIGHALTNAVQDSLVRYYRQCGYRTEWLPGTDHAGISCQVVVEKQLAKEGLTRHDLGREKFLERAYQWKEQYGSTICGQLRRLGSSMDWSREVFTLDQKRTMAHNEAFKRLFEKNLIYRDNRLVGWDCSLQTAISDIEIEPLELKAPQQLQFRGKKYPFGYLWHFKYPIVPDELNGKADAEIAEAFQNNKEQFTEFLEFGTTRPETMIGDSAIAVHPDDERYKKFHGKKVFTPVRNRTIPIVCDSICVDMNFGTGVVKITPAHDPNDFEVGKRHNLDFIDMLKPTGECSSPENPRFDGMFRFDARIDMIRFMTELGLYNDKKPNEMTIKLSQRTGDIIEPVLRPQWYIDCRNMAAKALQAMEDKELLIKPEIHEKTWRQYLSEIRPWCISRQLWWGHQIPLYKVWKKGEKEPDGSKTNDWIFAENNQEAIEGAARKLNCGKEEVEVQRDPDVTDTWFSSGLFPLSVFGWPESNEDLEKFFPGSVLETGYDILFFWVARMVMLSLELEGKLPFKEVYMHAMVRDSKGEKMSKSKGNVIDPLDCINGASLQKLNDDLKKTNLSANEVEQAIKLQKAEFPAGIAQCGTDALRLALCVYTAQARSINLDLNKIIAQRNFCNKIFNSVKFALNFCGINQEFINEAASSEFLGDKINSPKDAMEFFNKNVSKLGFTNRFILTKLSQLIYTYNKAMRCYDIATAAQGCVSFFWDNLCDIYIEAVKPILVEKVHGEGELYKITKLLLFTCIDQSLRMISIFMPFLCEEMFQHIPRWGDEKQLETIMFSKMPVDCKAFHFGKNDEWMNYDQLLVDESSIYTQIRKNKKISDAEDEYEVIKPLINTARNMKMQYNLNSHKLKFYVQSNTVKLSEAQLELFKTLTNAESVTIVDTTQSFDQCAVTVVNSEISILADVMGLIDVQGEIDKLEKEIKNINQQIEKTQALINSENYAKTPQKIKDQTQEKLAKLTEKLHICDNLMKQYVRMRK